MYAFKEESRIVAPPRKFIMSNICMSPILSEINWFAFLITVGSLLRSLTKAGNKYGFISLRSIIALLKPKTGKTMH